jgi:tetratricopeptide (TPR) repeat protein
MDLETYWEYDDPGASEARFRQALAGAVGDERLELLTQIARTFSLRGQMDQAHGLLDQIEGQLDGAGPAPRVRYSLERGRTFNSSGDPARAASLFQQAWEGAESAGLEGLAVDAAHMLAIVHSGQPESQQWTERGLALARRSGDAKAQALLPALLNNSAWELHDAGQYTQALPVFEQALEAWTARAKPPQIHIARWSLARCLRSLGRPEDALEILRQLEANDPPDAFVLDEIAENLTALGKSDLAAEYARRAEDQRRADG